MNMSGENFQKFSQGIAENVNRMFRRIISDQPCVVKCFRVNVPKRELWNTYIEYFRRTRPNDIFRINNRHDCSCCRHTIYDIGNMVSINPEDYSIESIWDNVEDIPEEYHELCAEMSKLIHSEVVSEVFLYPGRRIGSDYNFRLLEDETTVKFHHLYARINENSVTSQVNTHVAEFAAKRGTLKRAIEEISMSAVDMVLDLIQDDNLYRGDQYLSMVKNLKQYKEEYSKLSGGAAENYIWDKAVNGDIYTASIRNTAIGVMLTSLSEGMDLENAVHQYEVVTAPTNYKRAKPIYSQRQVEEMQKCIQDLGYEGSLKRRFATLDDVDINNVLFINRSLSTMLDTDVFSEMKKEAQVKEASYKNAPEVSVEEFLNQYLKNTSQVSVLFTPNLSDNMVSMIAPEDKTAPSMFKWDNPYSWAYAGNITDSMMKDEVRRKGGNVDNAYVRFSIMWNDIKSDHDDSDLDAHCDITGPAGLNRVGYIYYNNMRSCGGMLDVDIQYPSSGVPAVENIAWDKDNKNILRNLILEFSVHIYSNRGNTRGFKAEIEIDGKVYRYNYPHPVGRSGTKVPVAILYFDNNGDLGKIDHKLDTTFASTEIWKLKTNRFVPVSTIMWSPNYWRDNQVGNKHLFFMLKGCVNPETPNGFYNEFLQDELYRNNKRAFEVLGSKLCVPVSDNQLSGIGFSSSRKYDDLIVQLIDQNNKKQVVKIKF